MALEKFTFLDEVGIQKLSELLLSKVNSRISERIVQELTDASDANHVASATLLNNLLKTRDAIIAANATGVATNKTEIGKIAGDISDLTTKVGANASGVENVASDITALDEKITGLTHLTIDMVIGSIDDVVDPNTDVLYLQKDNDADTTWMLYIYRDDATWVSIGDTAVDLSNYWSKDDDVQIKESLSIPELSPLPEDKVLAAIDKAFEETRLYSMKIIGGDNNCTPNGIYEAGSTITISCDSQKEGYQLEWIASGVVLDNPNATSATFVMPANDVTITASYKKTTFHVTVSNSYMESGNGTGEYLPGATVTVHAKISAETDKSTMFYKWKTISGDVIVVNDDSAFPDPTGTFIMPEKDVEVSAVYEEDIVHKLTVVGTENDDGEYTLHLKERKDVYHGSKLNYAFKTWSSTSGQWYNLNSNHDTTFEMGEEDAVLTAEWESELFSISPDGEVFPTSQLRGMTDKTPVDLVIPDTAKSIPGMAFYGCSSIRSIVFSGGLTTIGAGAFSDCIYNENVVLPKSVTSIAVDAFQNNPKLTEIIVDGIENSILGAPWGATNATVKWLG